MKAVDGLLLTREEAAAAAMLAGLGVDALRRRNGSVPPAAVRLVGQLDGFGRRNQDMQASVIRETANQAESPVLACSPQIGVAAAATRLKVSAQTVRAWCRRGDLIAWRPHDGGPWTIDERSAAVLAARRGAGETRDHATEAQAI